MERGRTRALPGNRLPAPRKADTWPALPSRGCRAFTLVETLVSIAIFLILSLMLVSFALYSTSTWQSGIACDDRRTAATAFFSLLARDLRNAELPANAQGNRLNFVINPSSVGASYNLPQSFFWQAPSATDSSQGDLAVVGYFVQWVSDSTGSTPAPRLCRLVISSASSDYKLNSTPVGSWITSANLATYAPATQSSTYLGLVSENVLGLWICPLDQRQHPITNNAAGTAFAAGTFDSSQGFQSSNGTNYANALPPSVQVAIVTVDGRTAKLLGGNEKPAASTGATNFWSDVNTFYNGLAPQIKKGAQIHSTIITLNNAPR